MAARAHAPARVGPRRRPAARRRPAPRRRGTRIDWDRLGRVALTLVLAAILFSYLHPLVGFVRSYRSSSAAKAQLHALIVKNRSLHERVQATDDPSVLERAARSQGMVAAGERPYVVHSLPR